MLRCAHLSNAVASLLDAVGSHRTPSDDVHFEHTKNKHSCLAFARCPNRAQRGRCKVTLAARKVSYKATGAPHAQIARIMVAVQTLQGCAIAVQTHRLFLALHGDCFATMRQFACLVVNQIRLDNFAAFFNCAPVDHASDSIMNQT